MIKKTTILIFMLALVPLLGMSQPSKYLILDGTQKVHIPDTRYINSNNQNNNNVSIENRTVEFWFKVDDVTGVSRQVIYEEGGNVRGINFWVSSNMLYLGMYNQADNNGQKVLWNGTWFRKQIESNIWYHVALVLENGDNVGGLNLIGLKWYLDDELQNTKSGGILYNHPGDVYLSSNEVGVFPKSIVSWSSTSNGDYFEATSSDTEQTNGNFFSGAVGLFRIWNIVRSQQDIITNKNVFIDSPLDKDGLVAYLDGNSFKYVGSNGQTEDSADKDPTNGSGGTQMPPINPTDLTYDNNEGNNDWNDPQNWYYDHIANNRGTLPKDGDNIVILASIYPIISTGQYYFSNVNVYPNAHLHLSGGVYFNVTGTLTNNGVVGFDSGNLLNTVNLTNNSFFEIIEGATLSSSSITNSSILRSKGTINNSGVFDNSGTFKVFTTSDVTLNDLTNSGTFTIKSDAGGTGSLITNGVVTNTGTFTIERHVDYGSSQSIIDNGMYGSISSPFSDLTAATFNGHLLMKHVESQRPTNKVYYPITNTAEILNPAEGYIFKIDPNNFPASKNFIFTGTPNTGDQTFTLTSTGYGSNGDYYGWNLLGNPFPSAITWQKIVEDGTFPADVNETMYLFDGKTHTWKMFNLTLPTDPEIDNIPVGQAFFMKLENSTGANKSKVITIKNSYRIHNNSNVNFGQPSFAKKAKKSYVYPDNYLELTANKGGNIDKAYYHWLDEATSGFDTKYDSHKIMSWYGEHPNIYFLAEDKELGMQQEPETNRVKVGVFSRINGQISISIENATSFSKLILEDKIEGISTNLLEFSYDFAYNNSDDNDNRFILHFEKSTLSNNDEYADGFKMYASERNLNIEFVDGFKSGVISIYDIQGRIVKTDDFLDIKNKTLPINLTNGVYVVKINLSNGHQISKSILIQ